MSESTAESLPPPGTLGHVDAHADGGFWSSVGEALRGSHRDFTQGAVSRAILILAIPMVLEMMMESVFAVCDVFFVSKLGASAVATVGLTESWLTLIYALAMGLAIGTSAMVAPA
jgi:Na+-driven multidrug efflux pump